MDIKTMKPARRFPRLVRASTRLAISTLAAGLAFFATAAWTYPLRTVAILAVFALTNLGFAWSFIVLYGGHLSRHMAEEQDSSRTVVFILVLICAIGSFFAAAVALHDLPLQPVQPLGLLKLMCVVAIVASWLLTHTLFTLHYAHLYHAQTPHGLIFPGGGAVNDWDFAYFAFTVGMCFQTSDVAVTNTRMRQAVTGHALVSFAFTTVIIAMTINLLAQV